MPSLIGSGANQVPTNGMLGTMAFQDADNASVATKAVTDNSTSPASTAFVKTSQKFKELATLTTGTSSAYVLSSSQGTTEYYFGQQFTVRVHAANAIDATINVDGLGTRNLVFRNADGSYSNVLANDLTLNGVYILMYNGSQFEVLNRRQATSTEASSGTNTNSLITPAGLRQGLNASGFAPIYACRAWVNFDGTLASGDLRRGSGNVSSITDLGAGDYRITFTTGLPSSNYAVVITGNTTSFANNAALLYTTEAPTTTTVRVRGCSSGANALDMAAISVSIFV